MGRTAYRTKRKIFATLGDDDRLNLMIHPEERRTGLLEAFPRTFASLGGWTRLGWLAVDLRSVEPGLLRELLTDAWTDAQPVTKPKRPRKPKTMRAGRRSG